jgi:phosphate transport system substrate-binding protein
MSTSKSLIYVPILGVCTWSSHISAKCSLFVLRSQSCVTNKVEIRIAGADDLSGTYEYFLETVLKDHDNGETFDLNRPGFGYKNSAVDEELVAYLNEFAESIGYFGYSYYYANRGSLSSVAILNDEGDLVAPDPETIADGTYNPLARRIFMNLHTSEESLSKTVPFIEFGLSKPHLVEATGYVAIPSDSADEMKDRLLYAETAGSSSSGVVAMLEYGCYFCFLLMLGATAMALNYF